MPLSLHELFRNLHDEDLAARAECELSFLRDNDDLSELKTVLDDVSCDHPDSDASWTTSSPYSRAKSANWQLAKKTVELLPSFVASNYDRLLSRKSVAFRDVILEHLLLRKCEPLVQFLKMAIAEPDSHKRWTFLWSFMTGLNRASLTNEMRSELFDLLEPISHEKQTALSPFEFPRILAHLHPNRAREYFASDRALYPNHPELASVLRHGTVLHSKFSPSRLTELFEIFSSSSHETRSDRDEVLVSILKAAIGQQSLDCLPILESASKHPVENISRVALAGIVRVKLPHDPIRRAIEMVLIPKNKGLSREVMVVGYSANYLREFDKHNPVLFAEEVSPAIFRNTIQSLDVLREHKHSRFLQTLYDEIVELSGDAAANQRTVLRKAQRKGVGKLIAIFEKKSKGLDFERLSHSINLYVLENFELFRNLKE